MYNRNCATNATRLKLADARPDLVNKLTQEQVTALKREAHNLKKATGDPLHECLRAMAVKNGYAKWEHLVVMNTREGVATA